MKTCLMGAAALLLACSAQAQPAAAICNVPAPKVPQLEWRGQAAYQARATVSGGRVVATEIRALYGAVERRAQRAMVLAITDALRAAPCQPGEHVFEQRFDFSTGEAGAPAPAERKTPPAAVDQAPTTP